MPRLPPKRRWRFNLHQARGNTGRGEVLLNGSLPSCELGHPQSSASTMRFRSRCATLKPIRFRPIGPSFSTTFNSTGRPMMSTCMSILSAMAESPLAYKDATKVKAQITRFGLATVVGEIQPQGCIMAGEPPEPPWVRARREKRAFHKTIRRDGAVEIGEV